MNYDQLLRNLMVMAAADGRITDEEMHLLRERSRRWRVSEADFEKALEYAQSAEAKFQFSDDADQRRAMLEGFVEMMGVDGDYADVEMSLFAIAAVRLGVEDTELNRIIDSVLDRDDLILGDG